jgi:dolichol-phosphate mannosyltransferase
MQAGRGTIGQSAAFSATELSVLLRLIDSGVLSHTDAKIIRTFKDRYIVTNEIDEPEIETSVATSVRFIHIILPAFNEEKSLPSLLKRFGQLYNRKNIVVWVVDDGSSDKTARIAKQGVPGVDVRLVSHAKNLGLGQALLTGIKTALRNALDDDVFVVMDADDTHDPDLIARMLRRIDKGADIVIASRFVDGGDDSTAPQFRRLLSRGASFVFNTFLPLNGIHDFTSGFRAYRAGLLRRAVNHWGERLIEERGFACMVELLLKLRYSSPNVAEVPFHLQYDRKQSGSKLKLWRTLGQYLKLALRDKLAPPPIRTV